MSYSTKRYKPKTSKTLVRSSHSSVRPEVNVLKCPSVPLEKVVLEEIEARMPRNVTYKPRRSVGTKKHLKKLSPPKTKSKSSIPGSRSTATGARSGPSEPIPTDDFLEEMRAGLDEMGEKLRNVEKELTRQKIIGKPLMKPLPLNDKNVLKKNKGSVVYNPMDFTEMDFDGTGGLEVENSFEEEVSGDTKRNPSNPEIRSQVVPTNEAVESVIAKIRSDIKNWRISKGLEVNSNGDAAQEPSVTSNKRGEIVVREEAEKETPYESNRSSDGVTKVNTDSLSSDPSQQVKTKDPSSPSQALITKSPQSCRPDPPVSSSFRKNTLGESSSTTLSNSIPGIRHKEPQYPLDKYLPRTAKRDETFIKSRDIPLRKDVSLFRKIESLLKESQCIREPIVNCVLAPTEARVNLSSESSVSTEDIVAAEFYKATYGTPKKVDCGSKPKVPIPSTNRGAGDWVDVRSPHACDLRPKLQTEDCCREGVPSMPLPWDGQNRISALSPKTVQTETCFHPASIQTFESYGHNKRSNEYGYNMYENREVGKSNVPEQEKVYPKLKVSEACSLSSVPSVSVQTSASRLPVKARPHKMVTMQNACINTDRVNTHVFNIKHPDPDAVDDFAGQNRNKPCVVQQLPKVNIRARLVQQSCGFVSINPVHIPNEVQNTAVVEVSHCNERSEQAQDRLVSNELNYSPKRQHFHNLQPIQNNLPPDVADGKQYKPSIHLSDEKRQPAFSHRLAFNMGRRFVSPQDVLPDPNVKPKIFDTVSHFKEQLSREFNIGFEPIKRSLAQMVSSLNEYCDIGLNNSQELRNLSSTSKTIPLTLQDRVNRMDGMLTEELKKWGQKDLTHYKLLTKAMDELTNEIRTAVVSFQQQKRLNERTNAFLEGSVTSTLPQSRVINQNTQRAVPLPEPLKLDKLYAIHSYLQQSQPAAAATQQHLDSRSERQPNGNFNKVENSLTIKTKLDDTFTIDPSPPEQIQLCNVEGSSEEKETSPQVENNNDKGEIHGYDEDDFIPEDDMDDSEGQLSESESSEETKDSSHSDKIAGDAAASKADENLVVHLRTSGSANGEESTDAPMVGPSIAHEEPHSSVASTINASQANVKTRIRSFDKPAPIQAVPTSNVQKTKERAESNITDKPLVRLTNRNTNAVFELRLPEQLENLSSTLTYNSVGYNEEIKLSFGCSGSKERTETTTQENVPAVATAISDTCIVNNAVQDNICIKDSSKLRKPICSNESVQMKNAGAACGSISKPQPIEIEHSSREHAYRVTVGTETPSLEIPRITLRNQSTQFPTVEMESVERLSASILTLVESKMNQMVEANNQKSSSNESKVKDFSVQVSIGNPEVGVRQLPTVLDQANQVETVAQGLPSINLHTPEIPQETSNNIPYYSDGYDSHPKNLDKPTSYLVLKQKEREVENFLSKNSQCPVQLESSFSSVSVPTSLSEFPAKSDSTPSSELAFPLERLSDPISFNDLHRLHPPPEFVYDNVVDTSNDKQENECGVVVVENPQNSIGDISSHLYPNPDVLPELNPVTPVEPEEEIKAANVNTDYLQSAVDETKTAQTCIYEIQPYDSDLMSEGEIGFVYTSNSYSSGEVVERRKPPPVDQTVQSLAEHGSTACDKNKEEPAMVIDQDTHADDTLRSIEESSSSSETTTSETS